MLLAAVEGNAKTIETLLRCGANLYDVDKADKTALFLAAESDKLEALQVRKDKTIYLLLEGLKLYVYIQTFLMTGSGSTVFHRIKLFVQFGELINVLCKPKLCFY